VVATSRSSTRNRVGLVLTPRTRDLLVSVYQLRQATKAQLCRLHFAQLAHRAGDWESSLPGRVLRKLVREQFLIARPLPLERPNGRPPLVYSLGPSAVSAVSHALSLAFEAVLQRQRQDGKLSWLFWNHRQLLANCWIALRVACQARGYALRWTTDEELAQRKEYATLAGKTVPIRPDAFFVVDRGHKVARFVEAQVSSEPRAYERKARAMAQYYTSGAFSQRFGFQGLRVLAITDTPRRAANLQTVVSCLPECALFWSTTARAFCDDPFGPIWRVGGEERPAALLGGEQ